MLRNDRGLACKNECPTSWERLREGLPCGFTHDESASHSAGLEALEVCLGVPGHRTVDADDPVGIHGSNDTNRQTFVVHTSLSTPTCNSSESYLRMKV